MADMSMAGGFGQMSFDTYQNGGSGGMPSSFGYPQHDYMYTPEFVQPFLQNFMCGSIGEFLAMSNCANFRCGERAYFKKMARPRVHRYDSKNQRMKVDRYSFTTIEMALTEMFYSNVKIDDHDRRFWCELPQVQARYASELGLEFALEADKTLFVEMLKGVHCHNKGSHAGAECRRYDLGTCAKPLQMAIEDTHMFFAAARGVMQEQCFMNGGQMFMVLPTCFQYYVQLNKELNAYYLAGPCVDCTPLRSGVVDREINGFQIIYSDSLPKTQVNGKTVYHILFGYKEATCFARGFEKFETVRMTESLGEYDRAIMGWGHKVLYPELLGRAAVCLV